MSELESGASEPRIWLFDRRDYWRCFYGQALAVAGYAVRSWNRYTYPPEGSAPGERPDLVVLACTIAEDEERHMVQKAVAREGRVLVLATSLPQQVMRSLFLAGAYDVTGAPSGPQQLVALVERTLSRSPRPTSYESLLARVSVYE